MSKPKENKVKKSNVTGYPKKVVAPVGVFLKSQLENLKVTRKKLKKEDPFSDSNRVDDNASPDTDAAEQFGHTRVEAMKRQVDTKIVQTKKALARIRIGKYGICEDCGEMIDTDRLSIKPEAIYCTKCQSKRE